MAKSKTKRTGRGTAGTTKDQAAKKPARPRTTIMRGAEVAAQLLQTVEEARARGDNVKIEQRADGGLSITITQRTTKPVKPHAFPYRSATDPALIAEWTRLGMRMAIVRGRLRADESLVYQRGYVTAAMVAVAVGRTRRMVDLWAASGKFVWADEIGNERLWAADDLDRLLREGQFFDQSVFDRGHAGELAGLVEAALEDLKGTAPVSESEATTEKQAKARPTQPPAGASRAGPS